MSRQRDGLAYFVGLAAALGMHVYAFAVFISVPASPGAVPQRTAAISIELQATPIIEAVVTPQPESMDASDAATDADPGAEQDAAPAARPPSSTETKPTPKPVEAEKADSETDARDTEPAERHEPASQPSLEATPPPAMAKPAPRRQDSKTPSPKKRDARKPVTKKLDARKPATKKRRAKQRAPRKRNVGKRAPRKRNVGKRAKTPSKAARRGARPARSTGKARPTSARLSASRGQVMNYAARVRARVASRRPSSGRTRGTVVVSFGISTSGRLRYARISRSSGKGALDRAALTAVRRASPFPRPPRGMTSRQLSYSIPFAFR